MIERILHLWVLALIVSFIIEYIRWVRRPKGFRWNWKNTDNWTGFSIVVYVITIIGIAVIVLSITAIYIQSGFEGFKIILNNSEIPNN